MADSDLQAALHQSKVFDLNQVVPNSSFSLPFCPYSAIFVQKQMISMQFLDDFKRAILVLILVLLCCSFELFVHLLIIIR